ncbi:hypothetical protein IU367_06880 [Aeromonas bestiarum]|uniref:hypothetical protein n=1 Tax=Aeromonas bestiarum TaxID=105751 RepID=UPI0023799270|nr:hypothetical protein [Aeromonas bestiarum]WDL83905.1 hypothetical protein IU367_06880 [Aeromonas bestiarum]
MHIDQLIENIRNYIPFRSESDAAHFLETYAQSDRIAFASALYFGRSHVHYNEVSEDYAKFLFSGEMNRFWEESNVPQADIARILYEKGSNLNWYYDAFLRCTTNSNYNRDNY